jgi:hypothetical protein
VFDDSLALPPGAVLLHIGPHKTGTTAVQSSFHVARKKLRKDHGIYYVGRARQPMQAAIAVSSNKGAHSMRPPAWHLWERLVREVKRNRDKYHVVVSSEFFCDADDAAIERIVRELGGDRVHVVVTLRPLSGIFPSQWQQYLQNGLRLTYDKWLDRMINGDPDDRPSPTFWRRHEHGVLVERWVKVVGRDRLVVIAPEPTDRSALLNGFETILGLDRGFLVPEPDRTNRSLTLGETDLLRRLNQEFKQREWSKEAYHRLMRLGVIRQLLTSQTSGQGEPRMSTPQWVVDRCAAYGAESAAKIRATGVRVIGDVSICGLPPSNPADVRPDSDPMPWLPPSADTALEAVLGAIVGSGFVDPADEEASPQQGRALADATARELSRELAWRARRRLRDRRTR